MYGKNFNQTITAIDLIFFLPPAVDNPDVSSKMFSKLLYKEQVKGLRKEGQKNQKPRKQSSIWGEMQSL